MLTWVGTATLLKLKDKNMKHIQYEASEQVKLFNWLAFMRCRYPDLDMMYHIPNGGSRNLKEAANLKRQGVRAGVPDLCLPVPRGSFHGLYIELKYGANKPTDLQKEWLKKLSQQGYAVSVCYGWEAASKVIEHYINLKE